MSHRITVVLIALAWLASALPAAAQRNDEQTKLAQTGMKFLSVSLDPRAAALADAMTAVESGSLALLYNPAGMARQQTFLDLSFGKTNWIADIDYNVATLSLRPAGGRYGVFGLTLLAADYGTIQGTVRSDNEQGYLDYADLGLSDPAPTALAVGFGYARALTDRFSVGGHVKMAVQDLDASVLGYDTEGAVVTGESRKEVVAYDFGVLYKTGFRSLNFAVNARNFAREVTYVGESFQLPLTFKIGVSMDVMDLTGANPDMHTLLLAVDAEHPRDYPEQLRVGGEYTFMNLLSLRAGYAFPTDEHGVSLGAGLKQRFAGVGFAADYAYTDFGIFNEFSKVHRLAFKLML